MFKLYWRIFLVPYWSLIVIALINFVIASLAGLAAPLIIKYLIDDALGSGNLEYLYMIIFAIVCLYLVRGVCSFIYGVTIAKASNKLLAKIRQSMYKRLQGLDYSFFINTPTGEIVSLFTNDLLLLQQAISVAIPDLLVESLNLLVIMVIMIYFDWSLALVTFGALPFIAFAILFFNKRIANVAEVLEHTLAKVSSIVHQSLMSIVAIQSYVREDYEYHKFSEKVAQAAVEFIKVQRLNAILLPLVEFLAALGLTIIIWYGGREVIAGKLSIGTMFAFLIYIINIPVPIKKISEAISRMRMGIVAWKRIKSLDRQPNLIVSGELELQEVKGNIDFHNVSFEYLPSLGTLKNINISARPGEVIAIVGPSGAGKSSFANLLLRFYDPIEGAIYLDNHDIRKLKISSLRRQIGFIQQEPILFNATILENIKYGRPEASYDEVEQAAKVANAHDFIMSLPSGYNHKVGELGINLSGGQRQRIAIARAIIMNPAILLLDEPTAALDSQGEKQVMDAIRNASGGRTTFIITHRLSTLIASDRVIYLANGQIVEAGTHEELINRHGVYARAVLSGEF